MNLSTRVGISRRTFLRQSSAAALAAGVASAWTPTSEAGAFGFPVGLQLYTVKAELEKDFEGTLRAVARIGYRQVELPSYFGRTPKELRAALNAAGLTCQSGMFFIKSAAQTPNLLDDPQRCIDFAGALGLKYIVTPILYSLRPFETLTLDDFRHSAELLNRIGEQIRKAGFQYAYHNHNIEFRKFGETTGYDELLRLTDPKLVTMELDCGWVAAAGQDPTRYLVEYPGRFSLLHVKDLKADTPNTAMKMTSVEVGNGIVDWRKVLDVAHDAGVKAGFVEQEAPFVRPALESARLSYEFLKRLGQD
jgi:sugar phosphate isomerase/epimerase